MRSNIIIAAGLLLLGTILIGPLRPDRLSGGDPKVTQHGVITEMYQTVFNDLAVRLKGQSNIYYIDGAFEKGLSLHELKDKLMHKPVVIQYPEPWGPIKNQNEQYFLSKLEIDGEVLFSEDE